jgi:hypothetical protein
MAQECPVCGQIYGITHTCPGAVVSENSPGDAWAKPQSFSPLFYLRQAVAIARFDDTAILAASRDPAALSYGVILWLFSRVVIYSVVFSVPLRALFRGYKVSLLQLPFAFLAAVVIDAVTVLLQYGISHGLARWWFAARGTYIGILRPVFLGSFVSCTLVIPYVGAYVAGIWTLAILMCVFEEVDGIERMKAFVLAYGVGFIFFILSLELTLARR